MNDDLVNEVHRAYDSLNELWDALHAVMELQLYDVTVTTVVREDGYHRNRGCYYLDAKAIPKVPIEKRFAS
jgi:hypothetical protein